MERLVSIQDIPLSDKSTGEELIVELDGGDPTSCSVTSTLLSETKKKSSGSVRISLEGSITGAQGSGPCIIYDELDDGRRNLDPAQHDVKAIGILMLLVAGFGTVNTVSGKGMSGRDRALYVFSITYLHFSLW